MTYLVPVCGYQSGPPRGGQEIDNLSGQFECRVEVNRVGTAYPEQPLVEETFELRRCGQQALADEIQLGHCAYVVIVGVDDPVEQIAIARGEIQQGLAQSFAIIRLRLFR